jgi:hypothetical protein
VPEVLAHDFDAGFMLVTDLGRTSCISVLDPADPAAARGLMRAALDALIRFQLASAPDVAAVRRGVPAPRDGALARMADRPAPRQTGRRRDARHARPHVRAADRERPRAAAGLHAARLHAAQPDGVRAEPRRARLPGRRVRAAHLRRRVAAARRVHQLGRGVRARLRHYWEKAKKAGLPVDPDFGEFYRQLEWMGLQRHIKILGLFARINYRDGKPHYLADLPRFVAYARKVALRYRPLVPFAKLLDELEGKGAADVGYTF